MTSPSSGDNSRVSRLLDLAPEAFEDALRTQSFDETEWSDLLDLIHRATIADVGRAVSLGTVCVSVADAHLSRARRARSRHVSAHALAYANRLDDALRMLDEANALTDRDSPQILAGQIRMAMLHVLNRLGRSDEAIDAGHAALEAFERAGDDTWIARAQANLGVVHRMRNDPQAAIEALTLARTAFGDDAISAAQVDSNLAEALLDLSDFRAAERAFASALAVFEEAGLARACAIVEGNLADLMGREGRIRKSLQHFERARSLMDAAQSPGDAARLQAEEAEVLYASGLWSDAREALSLAIEQLDTHGMAWEAARAAGALAETLLRLDDVDGSRHHLDEAKRRAAMLESNALLGRLGVIRAELEIHAGRLDDADLAVQEAIAMLPTASIATIRAQVVAARLALLRGAIEQADRQLDATFELELAESVAPVHAELCQVRAEVHRRNGCDDKAIAELRTAVQLIEGVRGSLQAERLRSGLAGSSEHLYESLLTLLLAADGSGVAEEVFSVAEQSRSRALLDLVAGTIELPRGTTIESSNQLIEVARLRDELNAMYSRLLDDDVQVSGDIEAWRDATAVRERELQRVERDLCTAGGLGAIFAPPLQGDEARHYAPRHGAMIEFIVLGDLIHACVVDSSGTLHVARNIASRDALRARVDRLSFEIERVITYGEAGARNQALIRSTQRELGGIYDLLLRPLHPMTASANAIHIAPHRELHTIPFHALWDGERYLIDRAMVTTTPSATLLRHLAPAMFPAAGVARRVMFAFADRDAPEVTAEIGSVMRAVPELEVFAGDDASVEAFVAECNGAGLLHLAAHGRFNPRMVGASGIRLADGWVTNQLLHQIRLADATVVLSGCETGRLSIESGDELQGLLRGVFTAGASAALASLWPVHDAAAAGLVERFYANMERESVHEAWRAAMQSTRALWPHPMFWAPFMLQARPEQLNRDTP